MQFKKSTKVQKLGADTWASIERIPTTAINAATVSDEKRMTWEGRTVWDRRLENSKFQRKAFKILQWTNANKVVCK